MNSWQHRVKKKSDSIGFRLSYTCHKLDYYILDPKYDVCAIVNLESRDEIDRFVFSLS